MIAIRIVYSKEIWWNSEKLTCSRFCILHFEGIAKCGKEMQRNCMCADSLANPRHVQHNLSVSNGSNQFSI